MRTKRVRLDVEADASGAKSVADESCCSTDNPLKGGTVGEYGNSEENGYVAYDMTEAERYAEPAGDWVRELRALRENMSDLMGEIDDECGEAAPRLDKVREETEKMIDAAQAMLRKVDQLYRDSHM